MDTQKEFFRLFYKRELNPLMGKAWSNMWILAIMLFITFTVIGFAEGSLRYLERKIQDPFINWVNIIPGNVSYFDIQEIIEELNSDSIKNIYGLNNVIGYNKQQFNYYDYKDILEFYQTEELDTNKLFPIPGRTIEYDDPVIKEVFADNNRLSGRALTEQSDIGLIITRDELEKLNYPLNTPFIWMDLPSYSQEADGNILRSAVPLPVKGVVETLPGLAGMASSAYFFQQRAHEVRGNPFNPYQDQNLILALTNMERQEVNAFIEKLESYLAEIQDELPYKTGNIWQRDQRTGEQAEHVRVHISMGSRNVHRDFLDELFFRIYNSERFADYRNQLYLMYDYERRLRDYSPIIGYDRIAVNFSTLDYLRPFSIMINTNYDLRLDMAQVESRENYNFVSRLTSIISYVLIGFSILSILLFVGHLLKKHLESIKRNLGTFKAFGLSNKVMIRVYVIIVLSIVGAATAIALAAAALFGYSGGMRLILSLFSNHFEAEAYFSLYSSYLFAALVFLCICYIIVLGMITSRILKQSPGNLIYERA